MKLVRPICFIDLEATGVDLAQDRVIEICIVKYFPDEETEIYYSRVNPEGRPIRPEAFEKHGISEEDLVDAPKFSEIARDVYEFVQGCDFGGYNCKKFDIPMLLEELFRRGIHLRTKDFKIVDIYKLLVKLEPRKLEDVYKRFTGKELEGAHGAKADVLGTIEILKEMERVFDVPETMEDVHEFVFEGEVDIEGKLKRNEKDEVVFNFGKHKDTEIEHVYRIDPGYYDWIINKSDMTRYTKNIFKNVVVYLNKKTNGK